MAETPQFTEREIRIACVLRSLGKEPLTRQQAETAAKLLSVHRSRVYRLRRRFPQRSLTSAMAPKPLGQNPGSKRLDARVERVIQLVLSDWLPRRQRQLAHPLLDICMEVWRCCHLAELAPPGRNTVSRRWAAHRKLQAAVAPGSFGARAQPDIIQIDHTQADVFVVDEWFRCTVGRPWPSVAIDLATRCVVAIYVGMERPNAPTVALLSRV